MAITAIIPYSEGAVAFRRHVFRVKAGFPSPAQDYEETPLDLNQFLVRHPSATFFVRVDGDSMEGAGIFHGDILVVDKSLTAVDGQIIIAVLNGKFTVKRLESRQGRCRLLPAHAGYRAIDVTPEMDFEVWGVVTYVLHKAPQTATPAGETRS